MVSSRVRFGKTSRARKLPNASCCQLTKWSAGSTSQRVRLDRRSRVRRRPQPDDVRVHLDQPVERVAGAMLQRHFDSHSAAIPSQPKRERRPHARSGPDQPVILCTVGSRLDRSEAPPTVGKQGGVRVLAGCERRAGSGGRTGAGRRRRAGDLRGDEGLGGDDGLHGCRRLGGTRRRDRRRRRSGRSEAEAEDGVAAAGAGRARVRPEPSCSSAKGNATFVGNGRLIAQRRDRQTGDHDGQHRHHDSAKGHTFFQLRDARHPPHRG